MGLKPANDLTIDNLRWALRYCRRWPAYRVVSAATLQFLDPDVRRTLRELRSAVWE